MNINQLQPGYLNPYKVELEPWSNVVVIYGDNKILNSVIKEELNLDNLQLNEYIINFSNTASDSVYIPSELTDKQNSTIELVETLKSFNNAITNNDQEAAQQLFTIIGDTLLGIYTRLYQVNTKFNLDKMQVRYLLSLVEDYNNGKMYSSIDIPLLVSGIGYFSPETTLHDMSIVDPSSIDLIDLSTTSPEQYNYTVKLLNKEELEEYGQQTYLINDGYIALHIPTKAGTIWEWCQYIANKWEVEVDMYFASGLNRGRVNFIDNDAEVINKEPPLREIGQLLEDLGVLPSELGKYGWTTDDWDNL